MNHADAVFAMSNNQPVVYMPSGEIGIVQSVKEGLSSAFVLYLGQRLGKLTRLDDLDLVREGREVSALSHYLRPAGKVHGGKDA